MALFVFGSGVVPAQDKTDNGSETTDPKESEVKDNRTKQETDGMSIAESSIVIYSGLQGRLGIDQIRKTTVEVGEMTVLNQDGRQSKITYERQVLRGINLGEDKIRFDQKFPGFEYALIYDGSKIFGLADGVVFSPRDDATGAFQDMIWHGLEALLRYKENGSKVELEKEEKIMNVDLYILNVTDKANRQTKFYVSKKYLRVKWLEYESGGIQYRRKFYDHNYAQGTLVPYESVLWAGDKQIEKKTISTIRFGQTVSEDLFKGSTP